MMLLLILVIKGVMMVLIRVWYDDNDDVDNGINVYNNDDVVVERFEGP